MTSNDEYFKILIACSSENRKPVVDDFDSLPDLLEEDGTILDPYTEKSDLDDYSIKLNIFSFISKLYITNIENIKYATVDPSYYSEDKVNELDNSNYLGHYQLLLNEVPDTGFDCIVILNGYSNILDTIDTFNTLMNIDGKILIYNYNSGIYSKLETQLTNMKNYKPEIMSNFMVLSRFST